MNSTNERVKIVWKTGYVVVTLLAVIFLGYELIERAWLTSVDPKVIHLLHIIRGLGSSIIVVFLSLWYVLRSEPSLFPKEDTRNSYFLEDADRSKSDIFHSVSWLIKMRWIACIVAATLIFLTIRVFHQLEERSFGPLLLLVACLAVSNILYSLFLKQNQFLHVVLRIQMYADLLILTAMLHFSGGIENPVIFAYVFHIIIGGIVLSRSQCYTIVLASTALFAVMAFAEMTELIHHRSLLIFPHPHLTSLTGEEDQREGDMSQIREDDNFVHAAHKPLYVASVVSLQFILFALTAHFTATIVARLRAEECRAKVGRQRLERVVEATGAGLVVLDRDKRPVWLNDQIRKWLGRHANRSFDYRPIDIDMSRWGDEEQVTKTFEDKRVRVFERTIELAKGDERQYQITVAPIISDEGNVQQVVELFQDITERKMLEVEMIHAGKMSVLGLIAAGIAHEVGNPLASISTRLQLLKETDDPEFLSESIPVLQEQIRRIDRIVREVSHFSRSTKKEWTLCKINTLVEDTVNMLKLHGAAKKSDIFTTLDDHLPATEGVKDELLQVFLNLGINALEAMPTGGRLTITTGRDKNAIRITFSDTGPGLDLDMSETLLNPFVTTKKSGIGLGLYIAHHIVDAHGGKIELKNNPDGGALISMTLPIYVRDEWRREESRMSIV